MIKICVVCEKEYECYDRVRSGRRLRYKRPTNSVTCSRDCARRWNGMRNRRKLNDHMA